MPARRRFVGAPPPGGDLNDVIPIRDGVSPGMNGATGEL
jgi:hypothetical protein